jgi:hypothetical protein
MPTTETNEDFAIVQKANTHSRCVEFGPLQQLSLTTVSPCSDLALTMAIVTYFLLRIIRYTARRTTASIRPRRAS